MKFTDKHVKLFENLLDLFAALVAVLWLVLGDVVQLTEQQQGAIVAGGATVRMAIRRVLWALVDLANTKPGEEPQAPPSAHATQDDV